jgi:AraC-like DNA-binding protein
LHMIHFVPAVLIACLNTPFLFASQAEKFDFISTGYNTLSNNLFSYLMIIYMIGIIIVFTIQLVFYTFWSLKLYRNHKTYIENRFSYTENINLDWILVLIISFVVFFVFNDILYLVGFRQHYITQVIYNLAMLLITLYAGYRGLLQRELFENTKKKISITEPQFIQTDVTGIYDSTLLNEENIKENTDNPTSIFPEKHEGLKKYSGSALGEDQKKLLISKLQYLIQEENIFINDKLSIEDIANKLDTNTKYISQIINETYNKNFYNFINSYRIEEAKRLLIAEENDKYTILGIAQSVGFVSKSTFNVAFKKITGLTPSEYKSKMQ